MILRLTSIDQFGVLDDFKWNRDNKLQDFKEKNIIYGWNYSGKTTLSRLFSSLKEKNFTKISILPSLNLKLPRGMNSMRH